MSPATTIMLCASLMAIDGDTVRCCQSAEGRCEGQSLRPMGAGAPDISGFDTRPRPAAMRAALSRRSSG